MMMISLLEVFFLIDFSNVNSTLNIFSFKYLWIYCIFSGLGGWFLVGLRVYACEFYLFFLTSSQVECRSDVTGWHCLLLV